PGQLFITGPVDGFFQPGQTLDQCLIINCPHRMLERKQIFTDCLHLLTLHEPGNELHLVSEVSIPGGNVDYFLVSVLNDKVRDFVGIERQTLDTTGTVWPERQRLLEELGVPTEDRQSDSKKTFGMNWKMTAKTILIQIHHKIKTFEGINKKLVLVIQDCFLDYIGREFNFSHINHQAQLGDSMHIHVYCMSEQTDQSFRLALNSRLSTDVEGIARCLDLQAEANIEFEQIVKTLESKISGNTIFTPI
ncbi:MAG: NotI family restriction endonuclease, partial [Cyanobacteriota bacterium]|nr:NotI family restriction endonuclease [Cyanobacteriota bacterium]